MAGYRMPGPELDALVQKSKNDYDAWEAKQRSVGCRDRSGQPLLKPPGLLAGYHGVGRVAERWLEQWAKVQLDHKKRCVKCGDEP